MELSQSKPSWVLPAIVLGVVALLILAAGFTILFSPGMGGEVSTPIPLTLTATATPSMLPTASSTATRTPRPTWTLQPRPTDTPTPTRTPTFTLTPTRLPSLTAAKPYKFNDRYDLKPWALDLADTLVLTARQVPDNRFLPKDRQGPDYDAAFLYPAYAYREALLRSPDAPEAEDWRWGLAYSLAHLGDTRAGSMYGDFILQVVKQGSIRAQDLPNWFHERQPELSLTVYSLPPVPGYLGQEIIEIQGGVFLWMLEEPGNTRLFPLLTAFDFSSGTEYDFMLVDVNGDQVDDLVIYPSVSTRTDPLPPPRFFNLGQKPPVEIPVDISEPLNPQLEYRAVARSEKNDQGSSDLALEVTVSPACPAHWVRRYRWDGIRMVLLQPDQVMLQPDRENLQHCQAIIDHAAGSWSPSATLGMMKTLLPDWPPAVDVKGHPYPKDARDVFRYRVAVFQALTGQVEAARSQLQDLLTTPSDPTGTWIEAATKFLAVYSGQDDLYRACIQINDCDPRQALIRTVEASGLSVPEQVQDYLLSRGVRTRSSGAFDFDKDGQPDRWVVVQHQPGQGLEFWILTISGSGVRALYVSNTESSQPLPYYTESNQDSPIVQFELHHGFILRRSSSNGLPFLEHVSVYAQLTTYTLDATRKAEEDLLSGVDPKVVRDHLEQVLSSGRFNCINHRICDQFYYTLGLAYELSGDTRLAIDTYIQLWWENARSPFTMLARTKLIFHAPASATPIPTRTRTPTPTPTNTPQPTNSPSPTASLTSAP